jgi:fatty-acyl-CoA synthase
VKRFVAMTSREHAPAFPGEIDIYDEIVERGSESFEWPQFDENTAVAMCYTSGTTGEPKGVVYSHRSVVIQSFQACLPSAMGIGEGEVLLPVVPMFHVNAWNAPYSAMLVGVKQVFPGPRLDGEGLYEMFEAEKVTYSSGVPTVWLNLLHYLEKTGKKLNHLKKGMCGGSALPEALIRGFARYGVELQQGWGMTEMSPIGTVNVLSPRINALPEDERMVYQLKQGRALPFVDMRIVSPDGHVLPNDGVQDGHLQVRGPCIIKDYYKYDGQTLTADGWFDTGDVGFIDLEGYLQITDRSKDVIKTGGEWVSSIDIENAALMHPAVAQAGVIGVAHPKWQERPLLVVVKKEGADLSAEDVQEFLKGKLDRIAWPDAVEFVAELPLGATGKVLKTELRKMFGSYQLPE